ncbi:MAG: S1 RNA-binding domain-containing protein [Anaerolineales bacterium]|nr:S1 RNA-binding domain-containing protein [Anaerolineales bacterium]
MSVEQTAGQTGHPMEFLLDQDFDLKIPSTGETCTGIIVAQSANEILVDIGAKSEGIISSRELENMTPEVLDELTIGSEISVYIINSGDRDGQILLSYAQALAEEGWSQARELYESQEVFECEITGYNKGGLLTDINHVRAFIPASQLGLPGRNTSAEQLEEFIGQKLQTKVIEVDQSRNRLILSARAAARRMREAHRVRLLDELQEGDVCEGKVVNIEDFGAFVDIGGLQGLVHLSELSWQRISTPYDEVHIGDKVEVYVLNVDHKRQRVALSMKRLQPDPWDEICAQYQEGQLVEVVITKLEKYGAFARLNDEYGLEGLIHISELAQDRVTQPSDVVAVDDTLTARIIRIDSKRRQLGLSVKQVASGKFMEMDLAEVAEPSGEVVVSDNETLTAE